MAAWVCSGVGRACAVRICVSWWPCGEMSVRSSARRMRVTVNVVGSSGSAGLPKVILVPDSLQQLLDEATKKLDMPQCARRAWTRDGEPIHSISAIRDNQLVLVSTSARFPGRKPTARVSPAPAPASASAPPPPATDASPPRLAQETRPVVHPPAVAGATQTARLQQASRRHAELVDSIRVGERLVRELRQQVEKLRNRSAEERQKVDRLRTQAADLSESIAIKQRDLDALESQVAAAVPPMIHAPAVVDTDQDQMSRTDTARSPSSTAEDRQAQAVAEAVAAAEARAAEAIEQSQEQIRTLKETLRGFDSQLGERTAELATATRALAEQQRVADARVRELEDALRGREDAEAHANTVAATQQRSIDELEARLMSEVESRAATENQWQKEREQIKADCRAEVERVKSECESAGANAAAAADAAAAAAGSEQVEHELRSLRAELQSTRAAHEKEMAELHARHADDLTAVAGAAQQKHEAQLRETLQKLEDAEASRQSSAKALEDAQRQTMEVAVNAAQREEDQLQELTMTRSENNDLQAQLTAQSAAAASQEAEIVVLKQKLAALQSELDEANQKFGFAAADVAVAAPVVGGPQVAVAPVSTSPSAARDKGEQLVSVSKDRVRQVGKKAPTRGRQGRGGAQSTPEPDSASTLTPPSVIGDTVAAPALTEAQSIAAAKKTHQEAAAEAARQRRANKHAKASSAAADTTAVGQTGSGAGARSTPAAVPAPAVSAQGGSGAAGSHSDEMKGNAVFLKMQAKILEQEAKEDARYVACSGHHLACFLYAAYRAASFSVLGVAVLASRWSNSSQQHRHVAYVLTCHALRQACG